MSKLANSWLSHGPSRIIENLKLKTNRLAKAILNNCSIILKYFSMLKLKIPNFSSNKSKLSSSPMSHSTMSTSKLEINWPSIGNINWSKVRKEVLLTNYDIEYLKSTPYDWLARLVGIIDGDGYISILKSDSRGYVTISLKIGLIYKDLPMLESFIETLKIGRIAGPYKNIKGQDTVYLIYNKTEFELQPVLFPLLIYKNIYFLTNERRIQYEKALYYMESGEVKFKDIDILNTDYDSIASEPLNNSVESLRKVHIPMFKIPNLPNTAQDFIDLPFFSAWLLGFTIAEGSFFVKSNLDACFEIRQRSHPELFLAFNLLFKSTRKIGIEQGKYAKFSVSSKANIQEVINFFSFSSNPPLIGTKLPQYLNWLEDLKASKRYKNLKFP